MVRLVKGVGSVVSRNAIASDERPEVCISGKIAHLALPSDAFEHRGKLQLKSVLVARASPILWVCRSLHIRMDAMHVVIPAISHEGRVFPHSGWWQAPWKELITNGASPRSLVDLVRDNLVPVSHRHLTLPTNYYV